MATTIFTPEQANKLVPEVRPILLRLADLGPLIRSSSGKERNQYVDEFSILVSKLENMGVELKDPSSGLVDFPAIRFGESVYLCWKVGEPEVMYWHSLTEGFRGRKPLKPEVAQIR